MTNNQKLKVFTLPGANYEATQKMFFDMGYQRANKLEEADFVCFLGGSDVDPSWYGEGKLFATHSDLPRDNAEAKIFKYCYDNGIMMVGICRGSQFLHVMNGGKLWQDVDNHCNEHFVVDTFSGEHFNVSSTHHQMIKENEDITILSICADQISRNFQSYGNLVVLDTKNTPSSERPLEIESYSYLNTQCLGVQGHPEFSGYEEFTCWFAMQLDEFFALCSNTTQMEEYPKNYEKFLKLMQQIEKLRY